MAKYNGKLHSCHNTYLIVCSDNLISIAKKFAKYKNACGYFVKVISVSEIQKASSASELNASDIRLFLRDHYNRWSIRYLLILGSKKTIPMFYVYPNSRDHISRYSCVPTDFFYSDLVSVMDYDRDGYPGELFEDLTDVHPQIAVGRIPFDSPRIVGRILENIRKNELEKIGITRRFLIASSVLSYRGEHFEGKRLLKCDESFTAISLSKIATNMHISTLIMNEEGGLEPSVFDKYLHLNAHNFKYILQNGDIGLTLFLGHGSSSAIYRKYLKDNIVVNSKETNIYWEELISNTNTVKLYGGVFLSAACLTANPENFHNLGGVLLRSGVDAYVGLTSVGWSPSNYKNRSNGGINPIFSEIAAEMLYGNTVGEALKNAILVYDKTNKFSDIEDPLYSGQMNIYDLIIYGDPDAKFCGNLMEAKNTIFGQYAKVLNSKHMGNRCIFDIFGVSDTEKFHIETETVLPFNIEYSKNNNLLEIKCTYNKNDSVEGLFVFYIVVRGKKIPFFVYCQKFEDPVLTLSVLNKTDYLTASVFSNHTCSFKEFLYLDVKFDNTKLFCEGIQFNNIGINYSSIIDNYQGVISILVRGVNKKELLLPSHIKIANLYFRVKSSANDVLLGIINERSDSNKFKDVNYLANVNGKTFGDLNLDGVVDMEDLNIEKENFASSYMSYSFNSWYDLNSDGVIDGKDIYMLWMKINKINKDFTCFYEDFGVWNVTYIGDNYISLFLKPTIDINVSGNIVCEFGSFLLTDHKESFNISYPDKGLIAMGIEKKIKDRVYYVILPKKFLDTKDLVFIVNSTSKSYCIPFIGYGIGTQSGRIFFNDEVIYSNQ